MNVRSDRRSPRRAGRLRHDAHLEHQRAARVRALAARCILDSGSPPRRCAVPERGAASASASQGRSPRPGDRLGRAPPDHLEQVRRGDDFAPTYGQAAACGGTPALPTTIVPLPRRAAPPHRALARKIASLPAGSVARSTREKLSPTPLAGIVRSPVIRVPRMRLPLPEIVALPSSVTSPPATPAPNSVTRLPENARGERPRLASQVAPRSPAGAS